MEGEIGEATAVLVRSLEQGDASAAAFVYADDAKVLAPAGELIQGRAEIEAYWRAGIALGLSAVAFERQVLAAVAGGVVDVGRYAVSVNVAGGRPVVERGTYLVLHSQIAGGAWRRTVDVFNPDEPSTARHDQRKEERR
jgi:ketosteroid isomerase-like protein